MVRTYSVTVEESVADVIENLSELSEVQSVERVMTDFSPKFAVGDFALDGDEPTPSPEANTVAILENTGQRADEYLVEQTGKTVAEHNPSYDPSDWVVIGHYPHMSSDKEFAFPEGRLRQI